MNNSLRDLSRAGQAVWLDFLSRGFLEQGGLDKLVAEDGLTGVTSNPAIFEKAIGHSSEYDGSIRELLDLGRSDAFDVYEQLAIQDIRVAADILRPTYDRLNGRDGYVSLEVSPGLAYDAAGTISEGRRLWSAVDRPNLMIKVPGTQAGVTAVQQLLEDGINVNVTLLFSRKAYLAVAEAYITALENRVKMGRPIDRVASVASFFISRIDSQIDGQIELRLKEMPEADATALGALKGKVAIANAKLAYQDFLELIGTRRFQALAAHGAQVQRLLWASTGTKSAAYSDTLYVDGLIGPDTVNTMPQPTMNAFRHHGTVAQTLTQGIDDARTVLCEADRLKLDLDGITEKLVSDGIRLFADAADALLRSIEIKRAGFLGGKLSRTASGNG